MPFPAAVVEIAFDDGPYVLNPTWTDVTSWVRRMSVDRGRSDDWGQIDGTATVVLNNRTRRFDPYFTTGPYYGKLLPRRQIRIRATHSGTTYDVFRGFVDGWNPEWTDGGLDSTVTLSCFDAFQLLAQEQLPADWSRPYILGTAPRHYYPCDEPITSFTAGTLRDLGNVPMPINLIANAEQGGELAVGLPSRSVAMLASGWASTALTLTSFSSDFSVSAWCQFEGVGTLGMNFGNYGVQLWYDGANEQYRVDVFDGVTATTRSHSSTIRYDGAVPRMITVAFNVTTKNLTLWVNGVQVPTTVVNIGGLIWINSEVVSLGNGAFQQIIGWLGLLADSTVKTLYNLSTAYFAESTSARFNRIIAETPFPAALTSAPASPANGILDITNDAPRASDELRITADTEGGPLFVSRAGVITMFQQNQIRTQTRSIVSQATYGDSGLPMGTDVQITSDGDSMRNVVNVIMSGGGVYEQANNASVTANGVASQTLSTYVPSIANAQALANIVTGWGGQYYPLLSPVDVVLSPNGSWGSTLGLELFDRVTVRIKPSTGNTIVQPMLVQRIRHEVTPDVWVTTLEGSARWAAVFILGQSTLGSSDLLG